ncbi:MAG TPA: hypothetical protein VGI08_00570, partial [Diaminobutyricibacter sp.]
GTATAGVPAKTSLRRRDAVIKVLRFGAGVAYPFSGSGSLGANRPGRATPFDIRPRGAESRQ